MKERIKVGKTPPPHPRETTKGFEPTPSSGQKKDQPTTRRGRAPKAIVEISQDIQETSNFWEISYDNLIAKVRGQLEERLKIIPRDRLPFQVGPQENFHIIVATGNDNDLLRSKLTEYQTTSNLN